MNVKLTNAEMMLASSVGCMRHIAAVKAGRADRYGAQKGGWQLHIEGALGEVALAKAMGIFWQGSINSFHAPDLDERIQVRTRSKLEYELIVRDEDDDGDIFVLLTGVAPEYIIQGWIVGSEAKQPHWLRAHGGRTPAFFVPHSSLRSIQLLIEKRNRTRAGIYDQNFETASE